MFGRKRRSQNDFIEELNAHLDIEAERLRAEGMNEHDARLAARRNIGNMALAHERFYEASRLLWLEDAVHDTRHALRRLRSSPVFTATTILTLALGIGATTSIFTLVHAVLLKSLPVSRPDQLYRFGKEIHCCVWGGYTQDNGFSIFSHDLYSYLRANSRSFEELAGFQAGGTGSSVGVRRANSRIPVSANSAEFVSGNYFAMFGLRAWAGRALTSADDRPGSEPVAIMSYRLWEQKYGMDPSVIGAAFNFNGKPFTIVGIAPPGFYGDTLKTVPPAFFLPLQTEPLVQGGNSLLRQTNAHWLHVIGRLRDGVIASQAEAESRVALRQWLQSHVGEMDANQKIKLPLQTLYLSPGGAGITSMREQYETWLRTLMMVSGFILLIVCANVANLVLLRGLERRPQTSLSIALGAKPMRLVRQALTESVVLALLGGAVGCAVAYGGTRLILFLAFQNLEASPISASPSLPILFFALGVSLTTGLIFGIVPAWMTTGVDPIEALRGANRSTRQTGSLHRKTLVILQAALSLVLLSASGLLTGALRQLERQDFGFEADHRTVIHIDPVATGYTPERLEAFYRRIEISLRQIGGVDSVAVCSYSPLNGDSWSDSVYVAGKPAPGPSENNGSEFDRVSAGYFETIGNPIIKGRSISTQDTSTSRHVAVINESFARRFFRDVDPIGQHFGRTEMQSAGEFEVVGVAKDAQYLTYKPVGPFFFVPDTQTTIFSTAAYNLGEVRTHYLGDVVIRLMRGVGFPEAEVRRALADVDPNLPVLGINSLGEQIAHTFSQQRLVARFTSLFGILALVLASIGLYGVTAHNAARRTNEIGVRMALGANAGNVIALILRGALGLIGVGLLLGLPLTLGAGRFLGNQLYGMKPYDPAIIGTAALLLGISALIAAVIPALRASSVSPMHALRAE